MGGSIKGIIGAVLPVVAAVVIAFNPALLPFAALITGSAGLVGAFLSKADLGLGEWDKQANDAESIRLNVQTTQRTVPLIYGKRKIGSNDVFIEMAEYKSGEIKEKRMWIVSCLCEGPIEGIETINGVEQVFIDDVLVSEFNEKHGSEYSNPVVEYFIHDGNNAQVVDHDINQAIPKFDDAMRDTAYIVWKLIYKPDIFSGIPKRQVVIKGLKVLDKRTSSINWTDNPVWHLYDYLTNTRYGVSMDETLVDVPSFNAAANYCEDESYKPAWKVNYALVSQIKSQSIIDTLLAHFRGSLSWFNGMISLHYSDLRAESAVATIQDSDIARDEDGRDMVYVTQPSTISTPDGVLIKYVSEQKKWTLDDVYVGDTTGQIKQLEFPGFTDRSLALDMGTYMLERERINRAYSFTTRPSNIILDPNDVITISSKELFLLDKEARVIQSDYQPDGLIRINAIVENVFLYNSTYDPDPKEAYSLNIASPFDIPPSVESTNVTEEVYYYRDRSFVRLKVVFYPPEKTLEGLEYPWFSHVDVYSSLDGISWGSLFSTPSSFIIDPVAEGNLYIKLVCVSSAGIKQPFYEAYTTGFYVHGVSSVPPPNETYFQISLKGDTIVVYADFINKPDIAGYELRLGNGWHSNLWQDATLMSFTSKPTVSFSNIREGNHALWIDVKGKNGVYSGLPIFRSFTVFSPKLGYTYYDGCIETPLNPTGISYINGTHEDTETVDIGGEISLRIDRGLSGYQMYGVYTSEAYDISDAAVVTGRPLLISLEVGWALIGEGNTWLILAPVPGPTTWSYLSPVSDPKSWGELLGLTGEPATVKIDVLESNSQTGPWERQFGLEKFDVEVKSRYVKFVYKITDTQKGSHFTIGPTLMHVYKRDTVDINCADITPHEIP